MQKLNIELLSFNQVQCVLDSEALCERGIDIDNCSYHDKNIIELTDEIRQAAQTMYSENTDPSLPVISEIIPHEKELTIVLTWTEGTPDMINPGYSTFSEPMLSGEYKDKSQGILPIEELQTNLLTDLLIGANTGTLADTLKKYLNEEFASQLLDALSESGLEHIINSFFQDDHEGTTKPTKSGSNTDTSNPSSPLFEDIEKYKEAVAARKKSMNTKSDFCVICRFYTVSAAEDCVNSCDLSDFHGESALFLDEDGCYILALWPGALPDDVFNASISNLTTLYDTQKMPIGFLKYIKEHLSAVIAENATDVLADD